MDRPKRRAPGAPIADWRDHLRRAERRDATLSVLAAERRLRLAAEGRPLRSYDSVLRSTILPSFGELLARGLDQPAVLAWVEALSASGYAPRSVGKHLSFLSALVDHAVETGAADRNPCRGLPPGRRPAARARHEGAGAVGVLTVEECRAIVSDAPTPIHRRCLWTLLLTTGARVGEAATLQWGDLAEGTPLGSVTISKSWDCRERRCSPPKGGASRLIPVAPVLASQLVELRVWWVDTYGREPGAEDLLLPSPDYYGRRLPPTPWHENSALRWWRADLERIGIAHPPTGPRKLHATRHTFVTRALAGGADRSSVEILTHAPSTHRGRDNAFGAYVHPEWSSRCAVAEALGYGSEAA